MGQKNAQLVLLILMFRLQNATSSRSRKCFMTGAEKLIVQLVRNKFAGNRQMQGICTILNSLSLIKENVIRAQEEEYVNSTHSSQRH